jgi:Uma2 family endonuclease
VAKRPAGSAPGGADDVFLVIEVADSSLDGDRGEKAHLYAEAEIPDYWIVNLVDRCVEVRRDPQGGGYQSLAIHRPGDEIEPLLFPVYPLRVSLLFG